MKFIILVLILSRLTLALAYDKSALPPFEISAIPSPLGTGSKSLGTGSKGLGTGSAVLATGLSGGTWLGWLEPAGREAWVVRCAEFDASANRWGQAQKVFQGAGLKGQGVLALAVNVESELAIGWLGTGSKGLQLWVTRSGDAGRHWGKPVLVPEVRGGIACPALGFLSDGRLLVSWVERSSLYGGVLGATPVLLASEAAKNSSAPIAPLLDGGALVVYSGGSMGRSENLTVSATRHEPRLIRWNDGHWAASITIDPEIAAGKATAHAPQIAVDGGRVAVVWRQDDAEGSHLLVATSPDAGVRFLMPREIGNEAPADGIATTLLHDGSVLVAWREGPARGPGGVWLQRLSPNLQVDPPQRLDAGTSAATGALRLAVVQDYNGGATEARVLLVLPGSPEAPAKTLLVTVPEGKLLAAEDDDCRCSPTPAQLVGYPLRGTIVTVAPGRITLELDAVPGVMAAGRREFLVDGPVPAAALPGRECLGRTERRNGGWRLFDLRLLEALP